ncbi:MAG: HAMP domain-containing histidine kinase [Aphanocapsa sp. GSE-SYN-MK-11-07L]|jgi:two-component system NarL family sensor kinase|nr:HAMP domain-containing histidine kinase [Aphanocapsa sp. GSE-SYN-MK-11-07L]
MTQTLSAKDSRWNAPWLAIGLFMFVLTLEFITPAVFVFGYLYTGPILLVNSRLGRAATIRATSLAVFLTLSNLFIPIAGVIQSSTIANRLIASIALIVTGVLSDRNRHYQQAIAQQQAQLKAQSQLVRLREDFASTLTHDLKTPLLGAIETINAFQQAKFGSVSDGQQKVLATMQRSHQSSLQLVATLLDVYRNDTEGLQLKLVPVDLASLAEETTSALIDLASSRRTYLSINYGESNFRHSLWVQGDALQLNRVFTNLLINAINHSRRGGRVEVVLQTQVSHQVVQVIDTGAGITADEIPHLFERFYQADSDRQAKGSGLGLYLARQIIEAHGGTIWAENRVFNQELSASAGAIFGFRLPVYPFAGQ